MVIDTSAVAVRLFDEREARFMEAAMAADPVRLMSAGTYLETAMVVEARLGETGGVELDWILRRAKVEIVPITEEHAELARAAFRRFGKGRHPAGLNFGDCMAYALAKATGEPLLFKGGDFSKTDVSRVTFG